MKPLYYLSLKYFYGLMTSSLCNFYFTMFVIHLPRGSVYITWRSRAVWQHSITAPKLLTALWLFSLVAQAKQTRLSLNCAGREWWSTLLLLWRSKLKYSHKWATTAPATRFHGAPNSLFSPKLFQTALRQSQQDNISRRTMVTLIGWICCVISLFRRLLFFFLWHIAAPHSLNTYKLRAKIDGWDWGLRKEVRLTLNIWVVPSKKCDNSSVTSQVFLLLVLTLFSIFWYVFPWEKKKR